MSEQIEIPVEAEAIMSHCECGKKMPTCGTTEICLTCVRRLNPKEFRETLHDLLATWTSNRPDIEIEELHSLCPAIGSMIHLGVKNQHHAPADAEPHA
jgi:hypothetical protein